MSANPIISSGYSSYAMTSNYRTNTGKSFKDILSVHKKVDVKTEVKDKTVSYAESVVKHLEQSSRKTEELMLTQDRLHRHFTSMQIVSKIPELMINAQKTVINSSK